MSSPSQEQLADTETMTSKKIAGTKDLCYQLLWSKIISQLQIHPPILSSQEVHTGAVSVF